MLIIQLRVGVPTRPFALHKVRFNINQQRSTLLHLRYVIYDLRMLLFFFALLVLFNELLDGRIHRDN